jgi:small subunit ribosomal protein S1
MEEDGKDFAELLAENLNVPAKGEIFKGKVVRIDEEYVFIDFGYKSEGIVAIDEFHGKNGEPGVNTGDEVDVILEKWVDKEGLPKLSKTRADLVRETERLQQIYESGNLVTARITEKVKGGLIADIGETSEIRAFLPASQVDLRPQGNLDKFIGKDLEARITKLSNDGIVISRRVYLEEQRELQRKRTLSTLSEGKTISGRVVKIIDQGVFVELEGVEGFVPISELSWGRVKYSSDVVNVGDEITVVVLKIDENERILLSLKQGKPDPWAFVQDKYESGTKAMGKVVSIMDFGVFVELEPGVEGLVHVSEITWTKRFRHPKEVVNRGSHVETVVLEVDRDKRRISLSLRRIERSPWEIFKEKNPPGTRIKGKVTNVTDKSIFVEVEEDLVGLVRFNDISWKPNANINESFKVEDEIEVVVLDVDEKNRRIRLGIKQLTGDPWEEALEKYKPGETVLTGKVIHIKERGIVVELEYGVEGFIKGSDLGQERAKDISKIVKLDEEITAQVIGFERKKRQVNLSKKRYEQWLEKERVSSFMTSQGEASVKLGDLLGEKLKSLSKQG